MAKTNDECATLRIGNLPKASAVTTVSNDVNKGKTIECVKKQIGDGGNMPVDQSERDEKHRPDCCPGMKKGK